MNRKVIITNGSGGCGKDKFFEFVSELVPSEKYSSIDIIKRAAKEYFGWAGIKTEKDRKFLSDLKRLSKEYNNMPFNDIKGVIEDFNNGCFDDAELLLIDIREPKEIEEVKVAFNALTVLISNKNVANIESNNSDKNVFNYNYDFVITNNGSLEDLKRVAQEFVEDLCW